MITTIPYKRLILRAVLRFYWGMQGKVKVGKQTFTAKRDEPCRGSG